MRNISTKVNRGLLTPGEFNSLNDELENLVINTGGTLDGASGPDNNLNMMGSAGATYGSAGDFYEDTTGITNVIILSRESNLEEPQSYKAGLKVIFKATATNTGATTIDVVGLGTKDLTYPDGSSLPSGIITLGNHITAVYNTTNDRFELINNNKLVDNSIVDIFHRHSELVSPDGTTDPVFSIDNDGKASFTTGTSINEFSTDGTLAENSDDIVPTVKAVKTYVDASKNYSYFADYTETDQGAIGNGKSIKSYVDAIGSDLATICLRHNSGSATTTYTLTTSETIPSNITLEIENGAILDGTGTLTINGPFNPGSFQTFGVGFAVSGLTLANIKWFGAQGDSTVSSDGTNDTAAIQGCFDSIEISGTIYAPTGVYSVTQLSLVKDVHFYGDSNGEDAEMTLLNGSWLKLRDSSGLTTSQAVLTITHSGVSSVTKRNFTTMERLGIYGNLANNTNGNGIIVSAKNILLNRVSVIKCPTTGIVAKDATGADNDGMNSSIFQNLWVGYNGVYGLDLQRDSYSGDIKIIGGHLFWNEDAGVHCDQVNVVFLGTHIWWNYDGVIVNGNNSGLGVQFVGTRIYDNAAAGIRLINSIKNISIGGDIHGNGNQSRWAFYSPPKTITDIPQDEHAGIYCSTAAKNILIDNINFGYLKDTLGQKYGLFSDDGSAEFSIGTVVSDGSGATQWDRVITLSIPENSVLHGTHTRSDLVHPGFVSKGDINLNNHSLYNVDKVSLYGWDVVSIAAGVVTATSTTNVFSESSPVSVTDITESFTGTLALVIFRNASSNAITMTHNTTKIRNISGANIVLAIHESVGYIKVSPGIYQQIMGKI